MARPTSWKRRNLLTGNVWRLEETIIGAKSTNVAVQSVNQLKSISYERA